VMSFQAFIDFPFTRGMWALGRVKLIPDASQAEVLSDVGLSATGRAGELALIFVRPTARDRAPSGAMRPEAGCLDRKSFSPGFMLAAAQLFTGGSGEPWRALLPTGEITVEAVSAARATGCAMLCYATPKEHLGLSRHKGLDWAKVQVRLEARPDKQ